MAFYRNRKRRHSRLSLATLPTGRIALKIRARVNTSLPDLRAAANLWPNEQLLNAT